MTELDYDASLVIGFIIVTILISYVSITLDVLLFKFLYQKYGKAVIFITSAILAFVLWFMHFFGIWIMIMPNEFAVQKGLMFLSYVVMFMPMIGAMWLLTQPKLARYPFVLCAASIGIGAFFMHYLGMLALAFPQKTIQYHLLLVVITILFATFSAGMTLWLAFRFKNEQKNAFILKISVAFMMTFSIVATHYVSILAVHFNEKNSRLLQTTTFGHAVILGIVIVTCLILLATLFVALLEFRLKERNRELSEANKELTHLTMHDSLTQLPNRLYLNDYVKMVLAEHRLHRQQIGVVYIDLDRFKAINDAFGHHVGDQLLVQFANRISEQLTERQTLLRISGDEFLLIAEHSSAAEAEEWAQKILDTIQHGFTIAGRNINITASIGIAMYPEHGETLQELLMHADIAMLSSKEQGRNTYSVFSYNIDQYEERHQAKLINDLFKAIEEDQFVLFYQPKFTKFRKICGVEALIRWQHPKLGLLGPNMFIPLAEKTGLIIPLGYWVMEQACKQIQIWEQQEKGFYPISINLSAVQVEHKLLIQTLQDYLEKYQINTDHLIIEITESTAMHHIDSSIEIFQKIRNLGIKLSIDDFGTGHSSFLYLKDLPVNELKIDRAFIKDLHRGSKDELILASLIQLTRNLGLTITAEGIETEEQLEILNRLGCQQFQGFLLGKPFPKEVLEHKFSMYTS
ncbi:putative bifunctional diguanylate cyclase/phosphodiesterase [Acinetobacter sp. MB5]|uniref:putative bifunctional diguanylate cyclase/phosphodiesterase n=1 Tax=Acinetobacter sp. MB5 TaxID=2069438 RepID=UPI000DD0D725|nr:EAL domain-containing protein [Acinetobacter sp. MB5]